MAEFVKGGSPYDLTTYAGRFRSFLDVVDPRTLVASDSDIAAAESRLLNSENVSNYQLWQDQKLTSAVTNGATGERIMHPFRMSAFVPVNIPLVIGMLNARSVAGTLFWQWANQSFNSATNYANRPGATVSTSDLLQSYGIAVGTSCGLAYSFRHLALHGPPMVKAIAAVPFVVPYIAVAAAGGANVFFSRKNELSTGVPVMDGSSKILGNSQKAAEQGLFKTIVSRSLALPIPVLVLPAIVMQMVPKTASPRIKLVMELVAITTSLSLALPATLAIFPQTMEFDPMSLEPAFHSLLDQNGEPIKVVFSNKGL